MKGSEILTYIRVYKKVVSPLILLVVLWSGSHDSPDAQDTHVVHSRSLRSKVEEKDDERVVDVLKSAEEESSTKPAHRGSSKKYKKHVNKSGGGVYQAWNSTCGPIIASGRDILEYHESVACWEACHDFIANRILQSPLADVQAWLQSKVPFRLPFPPWLSCLVGPVVLFAVVISFGVAVLCVPCESLKACCFFLGFVLLLCWYYVVLVFGLVCMASCFVKDPTEVVREAPWAEQWLLGIQYLRLPVVSMKASFAIEFLLCLTILKRFADKSFVCHKFILPCIGLACFLWFSQLFVLFGYFLFKSGSHGAYWVCAKSSSAAAFGWMPKETPYFAGLCYAFLSFMHGLSQPRGEGPRFNSAHEIRKRPRKTRKKSMCSISDRTKSHATLRSKFFIIFVDVSLDIAQTMLFFCRGQPFFGVLNLCGLAIQASLLLCQMALGQAHSNSLVAVVLQSDAITHYMTSVDADMAVSAFYGKTYREAFGETYLSFIIAIFAIFTIPLTYVSDVILFLLSVVLSMSSVKSGVADALEIYSAEEEIPRAVKDGHGIELRLRSVPANHYYMRIAYARERRLSTVGLFRVAEALTCPVALVVMARASNMKIAAIACSLTCTFAIFVTNIEVVKKEFFDKLFSIKVNLRVCNLLNIFVIIMGFVYAAITSPFSVFLLYAAPVTITHQKWGTGGVRRAASFDREATTKCWFAGITWVTLLTSTQLPINVGIDFSSMLINIYSDAIHNFPEVCGILASVKLLVMISGFGSVGILFASLSTLQGMRKEWESQDAQQLAKVESKFFELWEIAGEYASFFYRHGISARRLEEVGLGSRRDPTVHSSLIKNILWFVLEKVYGRPARCKDRSDPDFDGLEEFLWEAAGIRPNIRYISPTSLSDDVLETLASLPSNSPLVLVPCAGAMLKLDPLIARLRVIQKKIERVCMYEKEHDLNPEGYELVEGNQEKESDDEDSVDIEQPWGHIDAAELIRKITIDDPDWTRDALPKTVSSADDVTFESFEKSLQDLLDLDAFKY